MSVPPTNESGNWPVQPMKVRAKGQITIPAWARRQVGFEVGDLLDVEYDDIAREIILRKTRSSRAAGNGPDTEGLLR